MNETTISGKGRRGRNRPRIKRPPLPRSQPRRAFSGIFGAPDIPELGVANGAADKSTGSPAPPTEGVARGVNAGYRVIEEYLRQGQALARSLWPGSSTEAAKKTDSLNMTERMLRSASDFAGLFSEFLQTFSIPGALPPPGSQPIPDFGIAPSEGSVAAPPPVAPATAAGAQRSSAQAHGSVIVTVDVESKRRTEVTVDLKPKAWTTKLDVHDLRLTNATAPRLTGIKASIFPSEQRVLIRIRVPDRHPAGTYSGLIVDHAANLPQGTVSVRILDGNKRH